MAKCATLNANNPYLMSRVRAGIRNRSKAAAALYVDDSTLERYESGKSIPTPERVLDMAKAYNDPEIVERHCLEVCPIGKHQGLVIESYELQGAAIGVIVASNRVRKMVDRIMEMIHDGRIDDTEKEDFEAFLQAADQLETWSRSLRVCAQKENLKQKAATEAAG